MQGLTFLYGLFTRDMTEIDAARKEQLNIERPDPEALYPAYVWQTLTTAQKEQWIEDEAKRYDRFNRLFSVTSIPVTCTSGNQLVIDPSNCQLLQDDNETALLSYVWDGLDSAMRHMYWLCGWRIKEELWPRLINRSVALGVSIPDWAKPDLTRKYLDVDLHDLTQLYTCGVWGRKRPLPPIHYALRFWLGRQFPREEDVQLRAETDPKAGFIEDATCSYVIGMAEVMQKYTSQGV